MTLVIKHYKRPLSAISVGGERMRITPAVLMKLSKPLDNKKINIYAISSGEYNITFYVDESDTEKATLALTDLVSQSHYSGMSVRRGIGAVSMTGPEIPIMPGLLHKLLTPVAREKINILSITTAYDSGFMFFDHKDAERAYKMLNAYIPRKIEVFKHVYELMETVTKTFRKKKKR